MNYITQIVKSVGPKLVPFFKTVAIYFVVFLPDDQPSILATILKCLPILSLVLFVVLYGMSFGDEYKYLRRILVGLIFCCIGDACLIWPNYFELGMLSFAIGHCSYLSAFGLKPLFLPLATILYLVNLVGVWFLMPGLVGVLLLGVPIYTSILTGMLWRAIARIFCGNISTWSKLSACIGAVLFVISDFIIGVHRFRFEIDHAQAFIMPTYYAAQLGIALSIVDTFPSSHRVKQN